MHQSIHALGKTAAAQCQHVAPEIVQTGPCPECARLRLV